jgi:hypothetical protein
LAKPQGAKQTDADEIAKAVIKQLGMAGVNGDQRSTATLSRLFSIFLENYRCPCYINKIAISMCYKHSAAQYHQNIAVLYFWRYFKRLKCQW